MKTQEYRRKSFSVNAVEVTLQNFEEVAEWCKGEVAYESVKMMGAETKLPVVKIKGQGDNRGREFKAYLGCFIIELKGSFRVYKPTQFWNSFEIPKAGGISVSAELEVPTFQAQPDGITAVPVENV
jgi:hypothetical protein